MPCMWNCDSVIRMAAIWKPAIIVKEALQLSPLLIPKYQVEMNGQRRMNKSVEQAYLTMMMARRKTKALIMDLFETVASASAAVWQNIPYQCIFISYSHDFTPSKLPYAHHHQPDHHFYCTCMYFMRSSSGNDGSDNNTDYDAYKGPKIETISKLIINIPFTH